METAHSASTSVGVAGLTHSQRMHFEEHGYVILKGIASPETLHRIMEVTLSGCQNEVPPVEFEADLNYPGAPDSLLHSGGRTIRRLKQAHSRDYVFTEWMTNPILKASLQQLLGGEIVCPLAHHNCIMTKEPRFSSDTGWHQDIRYWSFQRPDLVSAWLALGNEKQENGCLQLVPGSHRMTFGQHQFDSELFFRDDIPENQKLIEQRVLAELTAGDVLLFHCRTLHAATRNFTDQTKYSLVLTFRSFDNPPHPGSRSASSPEILIH